MSEEPKFINLLALGNSTVGKTCYLIRNTTNQFKPGLLTVGYNLLKKEIELNDGKKMKIKFYDTSGQERFHCLAPNFIKRADGIILMYDITNRESFKAISKWRKDILDNKEKDFPVILVGNKSDLENERQVQREEGENIAKEFNFIFYEVSNKDGTNVKESSRELISMVLNYNSNDIMSTCSKLSKKKMSKRKCFFSRIKC
jgi:small GTP-binding protein